MNKTIEENQSIIFFDGVCGLCNGFVDFLINRDKNQVFKFCSLQSDLANRILSKHKFDTSKLNTVVLLSDNQLFIKSEAVMQILKKLPLPYFLLYCLLFWIPIFFQNWIYNFVAKYRYMFFGKRETCRIPNQKEAERFL